MSVALHPAVAQARLALTDRCLEVMREVWERAMAGEATAAEAELLVTAMGPILNELIQRRRLAGAPGSRPIAAEVA